MNASNQPPAAVATEEGLATSLLQEKSIALAPSSEPSAPAHTWYKADNGSFFLELREPFFRFNLLFAFFCFCFLIFCAYSVIDDYVQQQRDPVTSSKLRADLGITLPGFVICNADPDVPINTLLLEVSGSDMTSQVKHLNDYCRENSGSFDASEQPPNSCVYFNLDVPAFSVSKNNEGVDQVCREQMNLFLDINANIYSKKSLLLGARVFLYDASQKNNVFLDAFCTRDLAEMSCTSVNGFYSHGDTCSDNITALSYDHFYASSETGTDVALSKSETQYSVDCSAKVLSWQPVTSNMFINERYVLPNNASLPSDLKSLVAINMGYNHARVMTIVYNPQHWSSMIGSLTGWFGFLTDGWGVISLAYVLERMFLYAHDADGGHNTFFHL